MSILGKRSRKVLPLILALVVVLLLITGVRWWRFKRLEQSYAQKPWLLKTEPSGKVLQQVRVVFEDPGKLIVLEPPPVCTEDWQCGRFSVCPGGAAHADAGLVLPDYATAATVLLSGWYFQYQDGDHHIFRIGSEITNIRKEGNILTWDGVGGMFDDNFDDRFKWCYYTNVIAWNQSLVDAVVDQDDDRDENGILAPDENAEASAIVRLSSYIHNPAFASKRKVMALPRGFFFTFSPRFGPFISDTDHHLLQLAYNLDHSEPFIESDKTYGELPPPVLPTPSSRIGDGFVSWESFGVLKDNSFKRRFVYNELVSGFAGNDVDIIQPPFSFPPRGEPSGGCITSTGGLRTTEHVIENVPFEHAIPVLTGWDLSFACGDEHVKEIGIWLSDMQYTRGSGTTGGTLRYKVSSVLRNEELPGFIVRHSVSVLGLPPLVSPVTQPAPDLTIVEIPGGPSFCKREGQKLTVRIKNEGTAAAPASLVRVEFAGGVVASANAPPIQPGQFADLIIEVPANCPSSAGATDCTFRICVDPNNQINELRKDNNCSNGRCVG